MASVAAPGRGLVNDDLAIVEPGEIAEGCKTAAGNLAGGGGMGRPASSLSWGRFRERRWPQQQRMAIVTVRPGTRGVMLVDLEKFEDNLNTKTVQQRHKLKVLAQARGRRVPKATRHG